VWRIEPLVIEGLALMSEASDIDWEYQNKLRQEWLAANPDAEYPGWTSI
jgi:hypothetical protein